MAVDGSYNVGGTRRAACGVVGRVGSRDVELSFKVPEDIAQLPTEAEMLALCTAVELAAEEGGVSVLIETDCRHAEREWESSHLAGCYFPGPRGWLTRRLHAAIRELRAKGGRAELLRIRRNTTHLHRRADTLARGGHKTHTTPPTRAIEGDIRFAGVNDAVPTAAEIREAVLATTGWKAVGPDGFQFPALKAAYRLMERETQGEEASPVGATLRDSGRLAEEEGDETDGSEADSEGGQMRDAVKCCSQVLRSERQRPPDPPAPPKEGVREAEELTSAATRLIQQTFERGTVPVGWGRSEIVPLPKVRCPTSCKQLRGISLLSHLQKLTSAIIARRLAAIPLATWQCGFRPKRGTNHAITALQQVLGQHIRYGIPVHAVFVDCTKAFDTMDREVLWTVLRRYGVGPRMMALISAMYSHDEISVRGPGNEEREYFRSYSGVKQGDNMSPTLFVTALDAAVRMAEMETFMLPTTTAGQEFDATVLGYADDLVLMHTDRDTLQRNIEKLATALRAVGLEVNVGKTEYMTTQRGVPARPSERSMTKRGEKPGVQLGRLGIVDPQDPRIGDCMIGRIKEQEGRPEHGSTPAGGTVGIIVDRAHPATRCKLCPATHGLAGVFSTEGTTLRDHVRGLHNLPDAEIRRVERCSTCGGLHFAGGSNKCDGKKKPCDACGVDLRRDGPHFCVPREEPVADGAAPRPLERAKERFMRAPDAGFTLWGKPLNRVKEFRYLGRMVDERASSTVDTEMKRGKGTQVIKSLAQFLRTSALSRRKKTLLIHQHLWSRVLYASPTWIPTQKVRQMVSTTHHRVIRVAMGFVPTVTTRDPTGDEVTRRLNQTNEATPYSELYGTVFRPVYAEFKQASNATVLAAAKSDPALVNVARARWLFAKDAMSRDARLPERGALDIELRRGANAKRLRVARKAKTLADTLVKVARQPWYDVRKKEKSKLHFVETEDDSSDDTDDGFLEDVPKHNL